MKGRAGHKCGTFYPAGRVAEVTDCCRTHKKQSSELDCKCGAFIYIKGSRLGIVQCKKCKTKYWNLKGTGLWYEFEKSS